MSWSVTTTDAVSTLGVKWATAAAGGPQVRPQTKYRAAEYRKYSDALLQRRADYPAATTIHTLDKELMNGQIKLSRGAN